MSECNLCEAYKALLVSNPNSANLRWEYDYHVRTKHGKA